MSSQTPTQAFEIAAGGSAGGLSNGIIAVIFALLFLVFAYIIKQLYLELVEGNLKLIKFASIVIRLLVLFSILAYFLLS